MIWRHDAVALLSNLKRHSREDREVLRGKKFVTSTRFLLCSYVEALKCGCDFILVLVKCRQNVANKLFITCVFNPVHPHTCNKLTALSALLTTQTTERSLMSKRGRGKLFLSVEVQNLHIILL